MWSHTWFASKSSFLIVSLCIRNHTCLGVNSSKVSVSYIVITFVSGYVQVFDRFTFDVIKLYYCGMERVVVRIETVFWQVYHLSPLKRVSFKV